MTRWLAPALVLAVGLCGYLAGDDALVVLFGALFVAVAVADVLYDPIYQRVGRWALRLMPPPPEASRKPSNQFFGIAGFLVVTLALLIIFITLELLR